MRRKVTKADWIKSARDFGRFRVSAIMRGRRQAESRLAPDQVDEVERRYENAKREI